MRQAILLAAAHGMTDAAAIASTPALLLPYTTLAVPLPGGVTTLTFFMASVVHFASDIGLALSAAMHCALGCAALLHRDASFLVMSIYFCFVHTPLHYTRLFVSGRHAAVGAALGVTGLLGVVSAVPALSRRAQQWLPDGARLLAPYVGGTDGAIHITHMMQKLVVAHVVVEGLHAASIGEPWLPSALPPRWRLSAG